MISVVISNNIVFAGSFSDEDIKEMIKEFVLMHKFNHPNVISLVGICLDAGPSPYIVLPFMENGSLLSYIKTNRHSLLTDANTDEEKVCFKTMMIKFVSLVSSSGHYQVLFNSV